MSYTSERVNPEHYQNNPQEYLIYLMHAESYRKAVDDVKGKDVLDFGCGDGYGAQILAPHVRHLTAVDVSAETIRAAQAKYPLPQITFQKIEPVEQAPLPFPDQSFDVVFSFQVIEHVLDEKKYLSEIHRVLRPGGKLFLSTPNARVRLLPFQNPWNRYHVQEFDRGHLMTILQEFFSSVTMMGLTLHEPWLRQEKRRTDVNKWVLWPVTNRLIPRGLRIWLLTGIWKMLAFLKSRKSGTCAGLDAQCILIGPDDKDEAPSLFTICRK